jgi:hypothetical protein
MKEQFKSLDVWFKVVLLSLFAAFFVLAIPYPQDSKQFPQLLAAVSFILTAVALAMDFFPGQVAVGEIGDVDDTELKVLDEATRLARRRRFYLAWAIILVSAGAGFLGGFLFSTVLLFAGFGFAFGSRENRVRDAVIAIAMTALIYVVFGKIMAVPLLDGILW